MKLLHDRLATPRALFLVTSLLVLGFPSVGFPSVVGAQSSPTTAGVLPPPPSTDDEALFAQKPGIDDRLAQLTVLIAELDARVAAQDAQERAVAAVLAEADKSLNEVIEQRKVLRERRAGPDVVRQEAALMLYIAGDPAARSFLDSLDKGTIDLSALINRVLFHTAEEDATRQVIAINAEDRTLAKSEASLTLQRDTAAGKQQQVRAGLEALTTERTARQAEQADLQARLARILAIAPRGPLTGLAVVARRPALAVKIDNHPDARPQTGLNLADVVYEELVEGGITRYIAIFHTNDASPIGPIRSGRTSDLELLANLNSALFASSGGNDGVLAALRQANLVSVIEARVPTAYFRDNSREAPHNLYTRTKSLWAADPGTAGQPPPYFVFRKEGVPSTSGRVVAGVTVRIGNDRVTYRWNGKGWRRSVNGNEEIDASGAALAPPNVIIQFSQYGVSAADSDSPEVVVTGTAEAWVLTDGRLIDGSWSRPARTAVARFLGPDGADIRLTPGATWIALPKTGAASVLG